MRVLYDILLRLTLRSVAFNTTVVDFFEDNACQKATFTVTTDTNAYDGQCGGLNGVSSIDISMLAPGCSGTEPLAFSE